MSIHAYDELVLAIAMPTITNELNGFKWYGLAFAIYLLTTLIGVVWAGEDTDQRGPLRIFLIGYTAFALGLLIAGFAQSMEALLIGRALQGLGGGISWTIAFACINLAYAPTQRPKMIAILDIAWVVPSLLAPIIGGYFVDYLSWRWIFLSQLPVLLFAAIILYPRLRQLSKNASSSESSRRLSPKLGAAYALAFLCAVILYISNQAFSWLWLVLMLSLWMIRKPFLRLMPAGFTSLANSLVVVLAIHSMVFMSFYGLEIFLPIVTTNLHTMSALETGILIGFGACAWCVASLLQARWSRSIPASRSIRIGFNLFIAGALLLITTNFMPGPTSAENVGILPHQTTTVLLYIAMGVCAFGTGMAFNTCVSNAMANTQSGQEGATSTSLGIISSLSVGLISGVGGAVLNSGERHGISFGYTVGAIWSITVLCAILALIMIRRLQRFEKLSVPNDLTRQTP